jgi:Na+/melibiose symporter-like transporter
MTAEMTNRGDPEQAREKVNALRVAGGLLLMVALLLYFFHLAEHPSGRHTLGWLALLFGVMGVALLWLGRLRLRGQR